MAAARKSTAASKTPAPSQKPLWAKLGVKPGGSLVLLDVPAALGMEPFTGPDHTVATRLPKTLGEGQVLLGFCTTAAQATSLAAKLEGHVPGDVRLWMAHPKGGKGDLTRDRGWDALEAQGFETVASVALDAQWSALRFRRVEMVGK